MISRQELEGKWKQIKGEIQGRWGELTEDDLQKVKGDTEKLVGVIQQKTGQSRREIETFLDNACHGSQQVVQQVADNARQFADMAGRKLQEGYDAAGKRVQEGYEAASEQLEAGLDHTKRMVKSRPVESVATAFGAGLLAGVVVSLLLRSNHRA